MKEQQKDSELFIGSTDEKIIENLKPTSKPATLKEIQSKLPNKETLSNIRTSGGL